MWGGERTARRALRLPAPGDLDSARDRTRTDRRAAARAPARSRRRRGCRGARPAQSLNDALARCPPAGAAGHAGARLPRPALARLGRGGARRARAEGAAARGRRAAAHRARPALAAGRAAVRRARAGRPGRDGGAAARAGAAPASSTPSCAASCASARRSSRPSLADPRGALQPSGLVARAAARRLARPLAGDRRRRQRPSADDPARQRAPRHDVGRLPRRARRAGMPAQARSARCAVRCAAPVPVAQLPGFAEGDVSVQDANAQRAAPLLLAAPLAARRARPRRLRRARRQDRAPARAAPTSTCWRSTATRRGWPASTPPWPASAWRPRTLAADAAAPARWWDGRPFEAILLDAPCSASGIVRRHPDVRWLRRPSDIAGAGARPRRACSTRSGRCSRRAAGCSTAPVRCSGPRAGRRSTLFCNGTAMPPSPASPPSPGHLLPLPDNDETPPSPVFRAAADGFFLRADREAPCHADRPSMTSSPPHGSLRRRSVLRALGVAALRGCCRSGGAAAALPGGRPRRPGLGGRADRLRARPRRGRRLPRATRSSFELGAQRRRRPASSRCRCSSSPRPRSSATAGTGATAASPTRCGPGGSSTSRSPRPTG